METQMDDVTVTVAMAIWNADDPTSGDPIGVLLHVYNPFIDDGDITAQLEQAKSIATSAAEAALAALDLPAIKAAARREAFKEAAKLADARAEYYAMSGHPDRFA
jgi:topoisomerase IA-like protein